MKTSIVAVAFTAFLSTPCVASDFTGCAVEEIVIAGEQNGHVRMNCQIANLPACAAQAPTPWPLLIQRNYADLAGTSLAVLSQQGLLLRPEAAQRRGRPCA